MDGESLRVAVAIAVDRVACGRLVDERIVVGDRPIGFESKDHTELGVEPLGDVVRAEVLELSISDGYVQPVVGVEREPRAVVARRVDERSRGVEGLERFETGGLTVEPAAPDVRRRRRPRIVRGRIREVDEVGLIERRAERDVEEPALPASVDGRNPVDRLDRAGRPVEQRQPARALSYERSVVREEREAPRVCEPVGDGLDAQSGGRVGRCIGRIAGGPARTARKHSGPGESSSREESASVHGRVFA